jgi:tetratricopeptide (TPR) repeat protein
LDYFYKGEYEKAKEEFEKTIELDPESVAAWMNGGVALGKLGKPEEAVKFYDKAIELKPDIADAWYNKACSYSLKGDKGKSLENLQKAIELDPKYKEKSKKDEDFKGLWDDEDFKKIVE